MQVTRRTRTLFEMHPVLLRALIVTLESFVPNYPVSSFWLDYIAVSRTCAVDNITRSFGLMPARFMYRLDYLKRDPWLGAAVEGVAQRTSETTKRVLERVRTFRL